MRYWICLQGWARTLRLELSALYFACRDPRTPWYAKWVAGLIVAYALSPIDLIPDPIPVLGYLDDLILLPLSILFVRRLIPQEVMDDGCSQAEHESNSRKANWIAASVIVGMWMVTVTGLAYWLFRVFR